MPRRASSNPLRNLSLPGRGLFLLALVLAASLLRLPGLSGKSLWNDEIEHVEISRLPCPEILANQSSIVNHPPLFSLLLHGVGRLNASDAAYRLPSLILSILEVLFLFLLVEQVAGTRPAAVASLLLACSPFSVLHGQMATPYAVLSCLSLLSLLLLVKGLDEGRLRWWAAYGMTLAAAFLTHHFAILPFSIQILYLTGRVGLARLRGTGREPVTEAVSGPLLGVLLFGLLCLPWLLLIARHGIIIGQGWPAVEEGAAPAVVSQLQTLPNALLVFLRGPAAQPAWASVPLLLALLALAGLGLLTRRALRLRHRWLFTLWLLLPLPMVVTGLVVFSGAQFFARYIVFVLPVFCLFCALGIERLAAALARPPFTRVRDRRGQALASGVLVAVLVLLDLSHLRVQSTQSSIHHQDWRGLAALLRQRAGETDVIVATGLAVRGLRYYLGEAAGTPPLRDVSSVDEARWVFSRYPRKVFVHLARNSMNVLDPVKEWLDRMAALPGASEEVFSQVIHVGTFPFPLVLGSSVLPACPAGKAFFGASDRYIFLADDTPGAEPPDTAEVLRLEQIPEPGGPETGRRRLTARTGSAVFVEEGFYALQAPCATPTDPGAGAGRIEIRGSRWIPIPGLGFEELQNPWKRLQVEVQKYNPFIRLPERRVAGETLLQAEDIPDDLLQRAIERHRRDGGLSWEEADRLLREGPALYKTNRANRSCIGLGRATSLVCPLRFERGGVFSLEVLGMQAQAGDAILRAALDGEPRGALAFPPGGWTTRGLQLGRVEAGRHRLRLWAEPDAASGSGSSEAAIAPDTRLLFLDWLRFHAESPR